jgi:acyl-CoA thioester hydrolase
MNTTEAHTVFRMPVPLRWSDLDAFNHVNNARYLTFIEQARIEWLESIGAPWVTDTFAPVLAQALLNYARPIEYPARVSVELFATKLGNSSMTLGHRIVADDGTLHCDGHAVVVWIDRATGKSRALPDGVRAAAERLLQL